MLKLYGRNTSINVQKAAWAIAEARLDWDWVDRYGSVGSIDSVEYRKINPAAQIPTLCDNELLIRQSNTIVRYIAKTYSKSSLWPQNVNEYIEAERWMDWQAIDNWKNLGIVFWGLIRTPKSERNNKSIFQATEALISDFLLLNEHLSDTPYIAGKKFTMGDIPAGAATHRFYSLPIKRPKLPHLLSWYKRLSERKAYQEFVKIPLA